MLLPRSKHLALNVTVRILNLELYSTILGCNKSYTVSD